MTPRLPEARPRPSEGSEGKRPEAAIPGYPPGTVLDPVAERDLPELQTRVRAILKRQAGGQVEVVWHDGDAEVIFHPAEARVKVLQGIVLVGILLETVETGRSMATVPFAISLKRPPLSGMLMTSERKPRGLPLLVDRWGDSVIAVAYGAIVEAANEIAAAQGRDQANAPLIAGAIFAEPNRLNVIPQARHPGDQGASP